MCVVVTVLVLLVREMVDVRFVGPRFAVIRSPEKRVFCSGHHRVNNKNGFRIIVSLFRDLARFISFPCF